MFQILLFAEGSHFAKFCVVHLSRPQSAQVVKPNSELFIFQFPLLQRGSKPEAILITVVGMSSKNKRKEKEKKGQTFAQRQYVSSFNHS